MLAAVENEYAVHFSVLTSHPKTYLVKGYTGNQPPAGVGGG